jgi:hypothetical protein
MEGTRSLRFFRQVSFTAYPGKHGRPAWPLWTILAACWVLPLYAGQADSVVTTNVGPGVQHIAIKKTGPYAINVLVVDLKAKDLRIESYRPSGLVRTSEQARRNDRPGHEVVAAINADFFSFATGWPVNNQVMNGQFVVGSATQRSHLAIDDKGKPYIDKFSLSAWFKPKGEKRQPIGAVDEAHRANTIVLHTSFSDTATCAVDSGTTYLLNLAGSTWGIGDTLDMVAEKEGLPDLRRIQENQAALWVGDGSATSSAGVGIRQGDTLQLFLGTQPVLPHVRTMVGGVGRILMNGKPVRDSINLGEKTNLNFLNARHPRTFVGFDKDSTRLYLCVVDGRHERSIGMNFREMAEFLISIGVSDAVNLDGGGSSTMVIRHTIVNSPSDKTGERPVANTLQVIRVGESTK